MKNSYDEFIPGLKLCQYSNLINLENSYEFDSRINLSEEERLEIIDDLLYKLITEEKICKVNNVPKGYGDKRLLLRGLLNKRNALPMNGDFSKKINQLLQHETIEKGIVEINSLKPISYTIPDCNLRNSDKFILWKGDITRLNTDAIVNAANSNMLGCFEPLHSCIDNTIHSAAGPKLREDCKIIMDIQKKPEKSGDAKITRAYNLPSKYVLHTVGPVVSNFKAGELEIKKLTTCYISCLSLANKINGIKSIAFPCISTGVFGFPKDKAAEIAVNTVESWLNLNKNSFDRIVFNVYSEEDLYEYSRVFKS